MNGSESSPAVEAFVKFVGHAMSGPRAERWAVLARSPKHHRKLLAGLDHDFEKALRPEGSGTFDRRRPAFAFCQSLEFGRPFPTVADALLDLNQAGGWLIITRDGSGGIYRPEHPFDAQREIIRKH